MEKDNNINEELEGLSPFLSKMKKEEGFKVPFNYFEKLEDEIMDKVFPQEEPAPQKVGSPWWDNTVNTLNSLFQPRYGLALATLVVILVFGIKFASPLLSGAHEVKFTASVEDIENYIEDNIEDFDYEFLSSGVSEAVSFEDVMDVNEEELNKYIDENILESLDLNTLEELL